MIISGIYGYRLDRGPTNQGLYSKLYLKYNDSENLAERKTLIAFKSSKLLDKLICISYSSIVCIPAPNIFLIKQIKEIAVRNTNWLTILLSLPSL